MRCKEMREMAWETGVEGLPETAQQHAATCAVCRSFLNDLSTVQAGLRILNREEVHEPPWGFSAGVLRRLGEAKRRGGAASEFFENAGRRVILATLVLVAMLLLAMSLPSSGPMRRQPAMENYWSQAETASAVSYPTDWENVPPVPVVVEVKPVVYSGSR